MGTGSPGYLLVPAIGRQWNMQPWMPFYKSKRLSAISPRMSARQNAAMMWNPMCRKECGSALTAYALRMIEVKGRRKGATTVTVSKNEILTALNKPEEFILAIVEVDGKNTHDLPETSVQECPGLYCNQCEL